MLNYSGNVFYKPGVEYEGNGIVWKLMIEHSQGEKSNLTCWMSKPFLSSYVQIPVLFQYELLKLVDWLLWIFFLFIYLGFKPRFFPKSFEVAWKFQNKLYNKNHSWNSNVHRRKKGNSSFRFLSKQSKKSFNSTEAWRM